MPCAGADEESGREKTGCGKMRRQNVILWLAVLVVAVLVVYLLHLHSTATVGSKPGVQANNHQTGSNAGAVVPAQGNPKKVAKVYLVRPNEVLAMVNGIPITLWDLIPLQSTNNAEQQIDPVTYNYFLQRAINRELIMQAAQAQSITLNQAQEDQLAKFRGEREQPYPGQVSQLSINPAEIEFELRDDQAFMLQTSLMAAAGFTPNVTPVEVEQYYQQHIDEFGQLPADPQARQQAWQTIDIEIRNQLAENTRTDYQKQLDVYMNGLKAKANIVVTPLTETLMNPAIGASSTASTSR